jgi:TetR/AcrR family transcriptional regulator, fatty acid metabolism regulator protein
MDGPCRDRRNPGPGLRLTGHFLTGSESFNSALGFPAPLRILCRLTSGNLCPHGDDGVTLSDLRAGGSAVEFAGVTRAAGSASDFGEARRRRARVAIRHPMRATMTTAGIRPMPDHPSTATLATGRAIRTSKSNTIPARPQGPPRPERSHRISSNIEPPPGCSRRTGPVACLRLRPSLSASVAAVHHRKPTRPSGYSARFLVMQPDSSVAGAPTERTFIETARRKQIVEAAIDTIAEVGFARTSFARIAARAGISRGLISYHFAGKDDLVEQVVQDVRAEGIAYIQPRIRAEVTASGMLRAYIESNLSFMREHRNHMMAIVEIARNGVTADGQRRFSSGIDAGRAERLLGDLLAGFQVAGELRPDFDPSLMAVAIRGAIDAVPSRLVSDPDLDIEKYATQVATAFDLATRPTA